MNKQSERLRDKMFHKDYGQRINRFETTLGQVASAIPRDAIFERVKPEDLWSKAETHVTMLQDLAENFKETLSVLKPEKSPEIERLFAAVNQPLTAFKETLFQETTDPVANIRTALEHLRKAMVGGYDFLILAKEINEHPSPAIQEILKLKEVYDAKEYIATVQVPETIQTRLTGLNQRVEALSVSLSNLEKALDTVKENLDSLREEALKFRSAPTETPAEKEEEAPTAETASPET